MGEVYRSRDTRLGREVAIKILPADLVSDANRRRFVQEAQAASALNHPHIITIYEIESADGNDFIVMEYIRGKSLDALIPRQGMRQNEALRIAIAVADALVTAHARGIVHRDLKPANVIVGTDGTVKVLDFGLAKLTGQADSPEEDSPTLTSHALVSAPGTIAGTAAYMAPEQATGGTVDARTDIFSFGAMLYEMVTGSRAFSGSSTAETLSAVIRAQPRPPSTVSAAIPEDLEKVILRCLRKEPQRRYQHIDDVKVALEDLKEESASRTGVSAPVPRTRRTGLLAAAFAILVLAITAMAWVLRPRSEAGPTPLRVVPLTTLTGEEYDPTFSPDGEQVAFSWDGGEQGKRHIYVTLVGSSDVRQLTSGPQRDAYPVWSPDGRQIGFLRERPDGTTIQLVSAVGGSDHRLSDFRGADSIAWSPDGQWLAAGRPGGEGPAAQGRGIYLVPVNGGAPRPLITSEPIAADSQPVFSPDGRRLAYASCSYSEQFRAGVGDCDVFLVELNTAGSLSGRPRRLTTQRSIFIGSLAWTRDATAVVYSRFTQPTLSYLWRVDVDGMRPPERVEVAGPGATAPAGALSRGRLAFTRVSSDYDIYRIEGDRPAQLVAGSTFVDMVPRLSPDGRRLAFSSARAGGDTMDIWVAGADGSKPQQLTREPGKHRGAPSWSPDSRLIAFDSFEDGRHFQIWIIDADGGDPRRLTTNIADAVVPTWSRDGRWIYFSGDQGSGRDIWRAPASGGTAERLTRGATGPFACESADGKYLLFQTREGDSPLMASPLAGGDARQLVPCVRNSAFGAGPDGVYYVPCENGTRPEWPHPGGLRGVDSPVHVMDLQTFHDRRFGTLEALMNRPLGLSISRDAKTIFYSRQVLTGADLMLIENFR
jgi:eukaryotic-like serine/threonine-protein kinase